MLEDCDNKADYRDLRRMMNRYLNSLDKWPSPPKKVVSTYPWDVEGDYSYNLRDSAKVMLSRLNEGTCPYVQIGDLCSVRKIALIKALRDFGGYTLDGSIKQFHIGLLEAKLFVEKYFTRWF
jgi:hypothetical protein